MQIEYTNDAQRGAGHGLLTCTGEEFPQGRYGLALERGSDHAFLGGAGEWGGQQIFLPVEARQTDGGVQLLLTPTVVDQLDAQERYRVHLRGEGGFLRKAQIQVRDVAYSVEAALHTAAAAPPPPEAVRPPEARREPEGATEQPGGSAGQEGPPVMPAAAGPARKNWGGLLAVAALLVLALAGAGAWYFFLREPANMPPAPVQVAAAQPEPAQPESAQPESAQPKPAQPESAQEGKPQETAVGPEVAGVGGAPAPEPPAPAPEPPAPAPEPSAPAPEPSAPAPAPSAAEAPAPAPAPKAEDRVRLFFAGREITPQAAARLIRELPRETPAEQDAVYRLYYFAGENGEASVLMEYAACLDPTQPPWGSIGKDAVAAWEIYEKAKATQPEAVAAQRSLRAWLEQRSAAGDGQARHWLRQLP